MYSKYNMKEKKSINDTKLDKICNYKKILDKTLFSCNEYKKKGIFTNKQYNSCILKIEELYNEINNIEISNEYTVSQLKQIEINIEYIIKRYGTYDLKDVMDIFFGQNYIKNIELNRNKKDKLCILLKYAHPYFISVYEHNIKKKTKIHDIYSNDDNIKHSTNLSCFDVNQEYDFIFRLHTLRVVIHNKKNKTIVIHLLLDDIITYLNSNKYIHNTIHNIIHKKPETSIFSLNMFDLYIRSICLKSLCIYSEKDIHEFYISLYHNLCRFKQKPISYIVREFINSSLFEKRNIIMTFLLDIDTIESQYITYILYDMLSTENNENIDTSEQIKIYDSLSWILKKQFRVAMRDTNDYTSKISNMDNKIPLEQQICLLRAPNNVKEKAMVKLKEIKSKTEDSGSKARAYLEGLLNIPFGIYREEPCLYYIKNIREYFHDFIMNMNKIYTYKDVKIEDLNNYSGFEIIQFLNDIDINKPDILDKLNNNLFNSLTDCKRIDIIKHVCTINQIIKKNNLKMKINYSGKSIPVIKKDIKTLITKLIQTNTDVIEELLEYKQISTDIFSIWKKEYNLIHSTWKNINKQIVANRQILDDAVHGHDNAKRGIERIIGQWIHGKTTGYCFGFEGPPGVGKTSLAKKGLAKCLKDENGNPRPFSFIAVGGSSNGSILDGHDYTYVGSTWGRIVDILMTTKCMNPVIFIDELDKVSKTEHGKEIIGILTHLVDPTQNDDFQDKYFSGIGLDLSKVLFVFSYNDVNAIDKILLDRIHRIKFEHLTIQDKIIITKKYLLPEIFLNTGLNDNIIKITDEVIEFIIKIYTCESGVRKLKEILFEIISEINLELFKNNHQIPINIDQDLLKSKYLKQRPKITNILIENKPNVGVIHGLWANDLGMGGIIPIQTSWFPSNNDFELKLTGLQGDVMKESMNVAKSLTFNLTDKKTIKKLKDTNVLKGIHIHCPEGAVPKDGPSAGAAITTCIYSLLNNKKINNTYAITGEITLKGKVTAIGGLEHKIRGGIDAGVKTFLYPKDNHDDFIKIKEKLPEMIELATFIEVEYIQQIFDIIFVS